MVQSVAQETQADLEAAEAPVHEELRKLSAQVAQLTALLEAGERGTYRSPKDEKSEL